MHFVRFECCKKHDPKVFPQVVLLID